MVRQNRANCMGVGMLKGKHPIDLPRASPTMRTTSRFSVGGFIYLGQGRMFYTQHAQADATRDETIAENSGKHEDSFAKLKVL